MSIQTKSKLFNAYHSVMIKAYQELIKLADTSNFKNRQLVKMVKRKVNKLNAILWRFSKPDYVYNPLTDKIDLICNEINSMVALFSYNDPDHIKQAFYIMRTIGIDHTDECNEETKGLIISRIKQLTFDNIKVIGSHGLTDLIDDMRLCMINRVDTMHHGRLTVYRADMTLRLFDHLIVLLANKRESLMNS